MVRAQYYKTSMSAIYECSYYAKGFVSGKSFQPIEFASKAGAFPRQASFVNFGRKKFF